MKTRHLFAAAVLLGVSLPILAQEPVVGVKDPESLFVDKDAMLNKNKQAALHIMRELLQCNQWDRAGEWITDRYIQHNPNAESGLAGVVYYFTQVMKRQPTANCGKLTSPVVAVVAEGDLVTVMTPRSYRMDDGTSYTTTWFDTWRFVNGKADEHWDPAQKSAP